jgi:hypothetical protein
VSDLINYKYIQKLMLIEILEYIFYYISHWLFSIYGLIFSIIIVCIFFIIFPKIRIPLLIYIIFINLFEPTIKEIDFWTNIRKKNLPQVPYKKNIYKDSFRAVYNGTKKEELIKPSDTGKGKLLTFHPHGICCISYTINRAYNESDMYDTLLNAKVAVHNVAFKLPLCREIALIAGLMPATKEKIKHYLDNGVNVSVFPSGTREGIYCKDEHNDEYAYIKNRKGIFELLSNEYENIQIYSLGEQHMFSHDYKMPDMYNKIMSKITGKTVNSQGLNVFSPRNIYMWHKIWKGTSNKTITYIGETHKYTGDVEKDRELYIERLEKLFNTICEKENVNKKLIIV